MAQLRSLREFAISFIQGWGWTRDGLEKRSVARHAQGIDAQGIEYPLATGSKMAEMSGEKGRNDCGDRLIRRRNHAEKDEPQPHVPFTLGLENLNPEP